MEDQNTIAAIATGMGQSGIGIIRVSGEKAIEIAGRIFKSKSGKDLSKVKTQTMHYGHIISDGEVIDEVMVSVMKKPHSYTCEDVVEINCHGGIIVTKKILNLIISNGARMAEPGEFTKRAFLNGRIDLSQAEAVMDIIHSENEFSLKASELQLQGVVSNKIRDLREKILDSVAYIEAALDDPEHISMEGYGQILKNNLNQIKEELKNMIDNFENGRVRTEGIHTVILGKPNAGKSSLLNRLLGEERAIVTEIEGTTRDILEEKININGLILNIIDTAGIRNTTDQIEKIGVEKALEFAKNADLILYVIDGSRKLDENDKQVIKNIRDKKIIIIINKEDQKLEVEEDGVIQYMNEIEKSYKNYDIVRISAKENWGIDKVTDKIKSMFYNGEINFNNQIYITNVRQKQDLVKAMESIDKVQETIEQGFSEELFTIDLMDSYEFLGYIIGESVEEDLADRIFERFCMGK